MASSLQTRIFTICLIQAVSVMRAGVSTVTAAAAFAAGLESEYKVMNNTDVTLQCRINNLRPGDTIIWLKNGQPLFVGPTDLRFDPRVTLRVDTSAEPQQHDLHISRANTSDLGVYSCRINGQSPDWEIELDIQYAAKLDLISLAQMYNYEGENVVLECEADGNPYPDVVWSKFSGKLPGGEDKFVGRKLSLSNISRDDSGTYQCSADNGLGEPQSRVAQLHVQFPPEVSPPELTVHSNDGTSSELRCRFHMMPVGEVRWWLDSKPLPQTSPQITVVTAASGVGDVAAHEVVSTLTIENVTPEDMGNYTCIGSNQLGEASGRRRLTGDPHPVRILSEPVADSHNTYNLRWSVVSMSDLLDYEIRLQFKNGSMTELSDWGEPILLSAGGGAAGGRPGGGQEYQHEYTLQDLAPQTHYTVTVQARNRYGPSRNVDLFEFETPQEGAVTSDDDSSGGHSTRGITSTTLIITTLTLVTLQALTLSR